jgi:hypothetical protein
MPASDAFLGAPIAVTAFAADEQEYDHYPELNGVVVDAIGEQPSFGRSTARVAA